LTPAGAGRADKNISSRLIAERDTNLAVRDITRFVWCAFRRVAATGLVLLSVIMVGQQVLAKASDKQTLQTFKDTEAVLEAGRSDPSADRGQTR